MTEMVIVHLASLIELAGALGIAGCCAAAAASLVMHRSPGRAQTLVIEGSLWGLGLKTAASLLKTLVVHDWNGILAFAARFHVVIAHGDYVTGKPAPDPFLRAAERLGVEPRSCLALEDSYNGIRSASAAGTMTIMVPDLLEPTNEMRNLCTVIARDLHEVRELLLATVPETANGFAILAWNKSRGDYCEFRAALGCPSNEGSWMMVRTNKQTGDCW